MCKILAAAKLRFASFAASFALREEIKVISPSSLFTQKNLQTRTQVKS
jgi:hypothetical protein